MSKSLAKGAVLQELYILFAKALLRHNYWNAMDWKKQ